MTVLSLFAGSDSSVHNFPSRALTRGRFFDICIQGRKDTTFRAESEIESFSYPYSGIPRERGRNRLIKLLRAHDGCLGANRR